MADPSNPLIEKESVIGFGYKLILSFAIVGRAVVISTIFVKSFHWFAAW